MLVVGNSRRQCLVREEFREHIANMQFPDDAQKWALDGITPEMVPPEDDDIDDNGTSLAVTPRPKRAAPSPQLSSSALASLVVQSAAAGSEGSEETPPS